MNAYKKYDDTQTKYRQIVYLYNKKNETCDFIANLTGYAYSTVKNYIRKFAHLLEEACELFKYSRKPKDSARETHFETPHGTIDFECPNDLGEDGEKFYLIRAFNAEGVRLFSKVGTTIRSVLQRMKEHLSAYAKLGIVRIVIDKVWDCGNLPAEGFESWFRAYYIRRWPEKFNKNDRFFDVDFDLDEAQEIFTKYVNLAVQLVNWQKFSANFFCVFCLLTKPAEVWYNGRPFSLTRAGFSICQVFWQKFSQKYF